MRNPEPKQDDVLRLAEDIKKGFDEVTANDGSSWSAPPELCAAMLDLICVGNMDSAWNLLNLAWPANQPHKDKFLADFNKALATSPYYAELMQFNSMTQR